MSSNDYHQIIVVNSFNSVFLDCLNNDIIEYEPSEMESIRISSCEKNNNQNFNTNTNTNLNKHKTTFSFLKFFFCDCFVQDKDQ
jgi:hypothetical protein